MIATGWSEAKKLAYLIADNRLPLNADWDLDLLKLELGELKESDFDLGLIGFSDDELSALLAETAGMTDSDEAPEPPAEPVSKVGDVWLLGRHRLVCGDCTDSVVVDKVLNGVKPHLMATRTMGLSMTRTGGMGQSDGRCVRGNGRSREGAAEAEANR
jgi:hypothetical protein